ncbi:MAG: hypothetical protein CL482_05800 [Acidobacteria bacterium]|nr:hypothetical protein [Acidobacteriota bacterium]
MPDQRLHIARDMAETAIHSSCLTTELRLQAAQPLRQSAVYEVRDLLGGALMLAEQFVDPFLRSEDVASRRQSHHAQQLRPRRGVEGNEPAGRAACTHASTPAPSAWSAGSVSRRRTVRKSATLPPSTDIVIP